MAIQTRGYRLSQYPNTNIDMRLQGNALGNLGSDIGQGLMALGQQRKERQEKLKLESFKVCSA